MARRDEGSFTGRIAALRRRADRLEAFFERRASICSMVGQTSRASSFLLAAAHLDMIERCLGALQGAPPPNGDGPLVDAALTALADALDGADRRFGEPGSWLALCAALAGAAEAADGMVRDAVVPAEVATVPRHLRGVVRALSAASAERAAVR